MKRRPPSDPKPKIETMVSFKIEGITNESAEKLRRKILNALENMGMVLLPSGVIIRTSYLTSVEWLDSYCDVEKVGWADKNERGEHYKGHIFKIEEGSSGMFSSYDGDGHYARIIEPDKVEIFYTPFNGDRIRQMYAPPGCTHFVWFNK